MDLSLLSPRKTIKHLLLQSVLSYHQSQQECEQRHPQSPLGRKRNCSLESDDEDESVAEWGREENGETELVQMGAEGRPKIVLILMSDTGGGHRASAEAIKDAFRIEYGDRYKVLVKDLCKEYAGWPLNNMEASYKFMVKHVQLWKVAFHTTSPRWVHCVYLAAIAAFYAKKVEAGFVKYKPDIIISVHPLMQHIPIQVLNGQNLLKRVIFVTVITDLNTCHRTW